MQIFINIVIQFSIIFLCAVSFSVIYRSVKFFHFAHGIIFTSSAYFAYLFSSLLGLQLGISIVMAILSAICLGCLIELLIYRPLRKKPASALVLLLASLGIYIFLQNIISMTFGDSTRTIRIGVVKEGINVLGGRITPIQIITICVSIVLAVALSVFLKKTKTGKSMRAVASDPELANVSGIASDKVILSTFAIGSGLAGLAGILVALDVDMTPTMGMHALMMGVVAMIIGGVNSIPGIALGALLLATAQQLGTWYVGSQWQDSIAFIILVLFLLFKPEGFFGKKIRSATV